MSEQKFAKQLNHENRQSEPAFRELMALTRELMLTQSSPSRHASEIPLEPAQNGWKIRTQLENTLHKGDILKDPEVAKNALLELEPDQAIIQDIEQLGRDILEEAFVCLGADAPEKLRLVQEDPMKIFEVVNWLVRRIETIDKTAAIQFDHEDYQPVRISPKMIGVYPDISLPPTCLGKSILAASFLEKTGLPVLHSGVMMSSAHKELETQTVMANMIIEYEATLGLEIPDEMRQKLAKSINDNIKAIMRHRGFHAAVYVKNGAWLQVDPNYGCGAVVHASNIKKLDEVYAAGQHAAKNKQYHTETTLELLSQDEMFIEIITRMEKLIPPQQEVEALLTETPLEELYSVLMQKVFKPLLFSEVNEAPQSQEHAELHFLMNYVLKPSRNVSRYTQETVADIIDKHVFRSKNGIEVAKGTPRYQVDSAYRQRLAADIRLAPFLLLLNLQTNWVDFRNHDIGRGGTGHSAIEAGNPSYRIGIAALSDVATFYGDDLPLSMWLTYWPSQVSFHEHNGQTSSDTQKQLAAKALELFSKYPFYLTYPSIGDLIKASNDNKE